MEFSFTGKLPKLKLKLLTIKVTQGSCRENLESGASSPREPPALFIHYQSVPLLCKVFVTVKLYNWEPFRDHCFSVPQISNIGPKLFPSKTDEIFVIFISLITPKHKRQADFMKHTHTQINCTDTQMIQFPTQVNKFTV